MKNDIVSYAKDRYDEEHLRFDHIERKCSQILAFTSILTTAIAGVIAFYSDKIFEPKVCADWFVLILIFFAVFALLTSILCAFLSINLGGVNIAPRQQGHFEHMESLSDDDLLKYLAKCYLGPLKKLAPQVDNKAKRLKYSYNFLAISGIFLALLLLIFFIREVLT